MKRIQLASTLVPMLLVFLTLSAFAQEQRGVEFELTVSNFQGLSKTVSVGIKEGASPGLDVTLGEAELPPQPPAEIFDVRLVSTPGKSQLGTGSLRDYRPIGSATTYTETYLVSYQAGQNATKVKVEWQDPLPGRVTKLVIDGVDMAGKTEVEMAFIQYQFSVVVSFNYAPLSFTANPASITFDANNRDPLPSRTVDIIPQGDSRAQWILQTDAEWLDLEPTGGEGTETVTVAMLPPRLPTGTYNGVINVRSPLYPARLDIPVVLRYTVGVKNAPLPDGMMLGQNFPNPAGKSTSIDLNIGDRLIGSGFATLVIHDVTGKAIMDMTSHIRRVPGKQTILVHTTDIPPGSYTYTLHYAGHEMTKTMIITK